MACASASGDSTGAVAAPPVSARQVGQRRFVASASTRQSRLKMAPQRAAAPGQPTGCSSATSRQTAHRSASLGLLS
jgi:hypothetical protein